MLRIGTHSDLFIWTSEGLRQAFFYEYRIVFCFDPLINFIPKQNIIWYRIRSKVIDWILNFNFILNFNWWKSDSIIDTTIFKCVFTRGLQLYAFETRSVIIVEQLKSAHSQLRYGVTFELYTSSFFEVSQ